MSHEITQTNGHAEIACGSNKAPWHGLGTVVDGLMTAKEALTLAHLDWLVEPKPVTVNGKELQFPDEESSDGWQGICRADTGDCLGITKGRYVPIQNVEAFDFFDALVGDGKAVYDTAGSLRGGKQVWLLAKVNGEVMINGDAHREYALMLTSHDGSHALQVSWVMERVVCANTLAIALRGQLNVVKIRHTANWKDKEQEARRVLGLGEKYYASIQEALAGMNDRLMSPEEMTEFSKLLVPAKDEKEVPTRTLNIREEIAALFGKGAGNRGASRWDALNAVTDYADHHATIRGSNSTRLQSSILGSGAQLKQRAFDLLTDEDIMGNLLKRPHVSVQVDSDFAALLNK